MVSLDERNRFIAHLRNAPSTQFAYALVFGEPCQTSEATTISDRAAKAISTNNKKSFASVVAELNRRKAKPDSDWILDDFLLFTLLVGSKKFQIGGELCNTIIALRRPTNAMDTALHGALRNLHNNSFAVEGEFAFVKLVFCELIGQTNFDSAAVKTVYRELTNTDLFGQLENFPKLLAFRAFDLLVLRVVTDKLDSLDAIFAAIEARAEKMSIRDWFRIAISIRPSVWVWIAGGVIALCSACFTAGIWFALVSEPNSPKSNQTIMAPTDIPVQNDGSVEYKNL